MGKSITAKQYLLFAEAWCALAVARFMLVFLPFKKIVPVLGKNKTTLPDLENPDTTLLSAVSLAIIRAGRYSPWRTMCFEQALAAKMMLKRRKLVSTIFFGVFKDGNNKLNAHAWLQSGGITVTGGKNIDMYTVLSSFKS